MGGHASGLNKYKFDIHTATAILSPLTLLPASLYIFSDIRHLIRFLFAHYIEELKMLRLTNIRGCRLL